MTRHDEERLLALLRDSAGGRLARAAATAFRLAMQRSRLGEYNGVRSLNVPIVLRLSGYAVITASVVHAVCLRTWPDITVGQTPLLTSGAVALIGLIVASAPAQVAIAWRSSIARRMWRGLSGGGG